MGGGMSEFFEDYSYWPLLSALLDWLRVLAATYIGVRAVRAYEGRTRRRSSRRVLQRRVKELEQVTGALEAQMQQVLEADRFASALLLRPSGGDGTQHVGAAEIQGSRSRH